jgi:hypothetical protein
VCGWHFFSTKYWPSLGSKLCPLLVGNEANETVCVVPYISRYLAIYLCNPVRKVIDRIIFINIPETEISFCYSGLISWHLPHKLTPVINLLPEYNTRRVYNFDIINLQHLEKKISTDHAYIVYISQLIHSSFPGCIQTFYNATVFWILS